VTRVFIILDCGVNLLHARYYSSNPATTESKHSLVMTVLPV